METFATNMMGIIAFAGGLVALTLFVTTKLIDLADGPQNVSLSRNVKLLLSAASTFLVIASVALLGGDRVFALMSIMFQIPDIGAAPPVPENMTVLQWFLVGVLDFLVAGGIWDWRSSKK